MKRCVALYPRPTPYSVSVSQAEEVSGLRGMLIKPPRQSAVIYASLPWPKWDCISDGGLYEMEVSKWKSLVELGCGLTRVSPRRWLDHVLRQLDRGPYYLTQHNPWSNAESVWQAQEDYRKLEVHAETMVTLARKPLKLNILCQQFH